MSTADDQCNESVGMEYMTEERENGEKVRERERRKKEKCERREEIPSH